MLPLLCSRLHCYYAPISICHYALNPFVITLSIYLSLHSQSICHYTLNLFVITLSIHLSLRSRLHFVITLSSPFCWYALVSICYYARISILLLRSLLHFVIMLSSPFCHVGHLAMIETTIFAMSIALLVEGGILASTASFKLCRQ